MEKALLGKTGFMVSRVTYGGIVSMNETQKDSDKYVSMVVEAGVNYFDVAPSYGDAQERLGPSLEPYRKNVYLACKTQIRDAKGAKAELLKSLEVLRTDYFDVYQLHAMTTKENLEHSLPAEQWRPLYGPNARVLFATSGSRPIAKTACSKHSINFPLTPCYSR